MEAFVAGATGLTGRFVVKALCEAGVDAVAHVRPDSARLAEWTSHFESLGARVDTTVWSADAMRSRFAETAPQLAFGVLGTTKKRTKRDGSDYMAVDYGMTAMLIDALAVHGETRFVYLSSLGVKEGVNSAYLRARWVTEEHLRDSGLPHLIARPSFILGNRDEKRWMESIGGGVSDAVIGGVGIFGARKFARRYGSIQGEELGDGLVREALAWPSGGRLLHSEDLRSYEVKGKGE